MSFPTLRAFAINAELAVIYKAFPAFNFGWFHTTTTAPNLLQDKKAAIAFKEHISVLAKFRY